MSWLRNHPHLHVHVHNSLSQESSDCLHETWLFCQLSSSACIHKIWSVLANKSKSIPGCMFWMWVCPYFRGEAHVCQMPWRLICACLCTPILFSKEASCAMICGCGIIHTFSRGSIFFPAIPHFWVLMKSMGSVQAGISAETPTWKPWAYAHWHPWSTVCEFQGDIIMAEVKQWDDSDVCCFCVRCYSALGNIAKARYLKETVTIAEEVERQVVSVGRKINHHFIYTCWVFMVREPSLHTWCNNAIFLGQSKTFNQQENGLLQLLILHN